MSKEIIPSVGVVVISENKVCLVRQDEGANHRTGLFGLPARRNRPGETDLQAAMRTLNDETGLNAGSEDFSEFPGNYFEAEVLNKSGAMESFGWRVFRVKNFSGELNGNEEVTPEWVPLGNLEDLEQKEILLPNTTNAINAALR